MKKELLVKIKSQGYWRVNFQPVTVKNFTTLKECKEIIERSSVSLRGWDYPHIPRRNDGNGAMLACGEYFEGFEDWAMYKEFWRMYKSGQFLYYRGLREDWLAEDNWREELAKKIKPGTVVSMISSVIYEVTEMFEFLSRLIENGLYQDGVEVDITLKNIESRELWIGDEMRIPFMFPKKTGAKEISFKNKFSKEEIIENSKIIANRFILEIFDSFEFNPSSEQIMKDQEKLLSGRM